MQTTISPLYPIAPTSNQVDDYHGVRVADPYRWLENADAPETRAWIEAENRLADDYLASVPQREVDPEAAERTLGLREIRHPRPQGRSLFLHEERRAPEPVGPLYDDGRREAEPQVLLDPNTLVGGRNHRARGMRRRARTAAISAYGSGERRIRLERMARSGRRDGRGPGRSSGVGEILGGVLDARRQGLLLQPIRRPRSFRSPRRGELLPEALLPHVGHAAGRGRAHLRTAGSEGLGFRRIR